jgi:hypothetical protein
MARWKKDDATKGAVYMRAWTEDTDAGKAYKKNSADYAREWRKNNPEYAKAIQERSYNKIRRECFERYGNGKAQCRCCGEKEFKFLHLDHINGDGWEFRKAWTENNGKVVGGTGFYYWLKKNGWPDLALQVLCANCNLGKRTGKYCPHEVARGVDMLGNTIPLDELPKPFPDLRRRSRGEAQRQAAELGITARALQARERRARKAK